MASDRRRTPRYPQFRQSVGPPAYPLGKLDEDDDGALDIMIGNYRGTVRIDFGKKIEWFAVPPEQARAVAELLIKYAEQLEGQVEITITKTAVTPDKQQQ